MIWPYASLRTYAASFRPGGKRLAVAALATAAALASLTTAASSQSRFAPDSPLVSTLAGSGAVGIADGPGATATFVAPAGIAFDDAGNLVVADRDAQRIRVVSRSGAVTTLAGGAPLIPLGYAAGGGYRDGPAAQALFNMPSAVLPLPDGSVLVADTYNHCLRLISHGAVTTFAGSLTAGSLDGPRASAQFKRPTSLARDASGDIFVADPPNGVRKIDAQGIVSTLNFRDSHNAIAVAAVPGSSTFLLVASVSLIQRVNTQTLAVDRPFPLEFGFGAQPDTNGQLILREGITGPVSALAAFASGDFVFTDALDSAVRLGQTAATADGYYNYTRPLTAVPPEDASLGIAGFRDGPGDKALVDEPVGIAISRDGRVAVADTGNRRIRLLSDYNRLTHVSTEETHAELPSEPNRHEFRVALVGSSYVWWNQAWHESLAGATEDLLAAAPHGTRTPRVYPVMRLGICSPPALDLIDEELSTGIVDMVVLDLSTYAQMGGDGYAGFCFDNTWQAKLKAHLIETAATLKAAHVGFLVLNFPGASDFPDEYAYFRIYKGPSADTGTQNEPTNIQRFHDATAAVLQESGVPTLDLWPAFVAAYDAPNRVPLFNVWDHHLSAFGRRLVVTRLAKVLLSSKGLSQKAP